MTRRWFPVGGMLAAAAVLLLLMPEKSEAQAHRFGRGGLEVRTPGSTPTPAIPRGITPLDRAPTAGPPVTYYGWGYAPRYWREGYVRGWSPGYYGGSVGYPMPRSGTFYGSAGALPTYYGQGPEGTPGFGENRSVLITMQVPPKAEVWFDGRKTQQGGMIRSYVSPPLTPGANYTYQVQARWTANGEPVTRTRELRVQAGDQMNLDLLMPREAGTETPSKGSTSAPEQP